MRNLILKNKKKYGKLTPAPGSQCIGQTNAVICAINLCQMKDNVSMYSWCHTVPIVTTQKQNILV